LARGARSRLRIRRPLLVGLLFAPVREGPASFRSRPRRPVLLPAKHSAGSKLDGSLPRGKLLQRRWQVDRRSYSGAAFTKDAESALRTNVSGERTVNLFWLKTKIETLDSRRPLSARPKAPRVCRWSDVFIPRIRRSNHRMASPLTCVPIRRMSRKLHNDCRRYGTADTWRRSAKGVGRLPSFALGTAALVTRRDPRPLVRIR
jgi:hypothetical protein